MNKNIEIQPNIIDKDRFKYLREEYIPARNHVTEAMMFINPETPGYWKTKAVAGRRFFLLQRESEINELTNIYNRKGFDKHLKEEAERMKRLKGKSTLIIADVNNLKIINDQKGHDAGDEYLKNVAGTMINAVREIDVVARIGGDEFAIILTGIGIGKTRELWEKRINIQFEDAGISLAAGATEINPNDLKTTFHHADQAMYWAKAESKLRNKNLLFTFGETK